MVTDGCVGADNRIGVKFCVISDANIGTDIYAGAYQHVFADGGRGMNKTSFSFCPLLIPNLAIFSISLPVFECIINMTFAGENIFANILDLLQDTNEYSIIPIFFLKASPYFCT